jgi:hypothetical protein
MDALLRSAALWQNLLLAATYAGLGWVVLSVAVPHG